MNRSDELEAAFRKWEQARHALGDLRKRLPASSGGQMAQSPDVAELYEQIRAQEDLCGQLFGAVTQIAEKVADLRQQEELAAQVARVLDGRGRFET